MFSLIRHHLSDFINDLKEDSHLKHKKSYSQSGEDMIVNFIFEQLGIDYPTYIDVGAFNPYILSNTAFFYKKGCHGINIEPNPTSFKEFTRIRKRDVNLNIGIADKEDYLKYFNFEESALNTFSETEARRIIELGKKLTGTLQIKTRSLVEVLIQYCPQTKPDFMSIDVEGFDAEIIQQTVRQDFFYPIVICVETINYSLKGDGSKNKDISIHLEKQGYLLYADTNINSIFVRKDYWLR